MSNFEEDPRVKYINDLRRLDQVERFGAKGAKIGAGVGAGLGAAALLAARLHTGSMPKVSLVKALIGSTLAGATLGAGTGVIAGQTKKLKPLEAQASQVLIEGIIEGMSG